MAKMINLEKYLLNNFNSILKKLIILYIFFSNFITGTFGQSFEKDYIPIKSIDKIPQEFTLAASMRIQKELTTGKSDKKRRYKKLNKDLVINSHFDLNDLYQSGYILLNDTISNYVNAVANEIIQKEPELKGKLKIYVIRSTEANAYCFENGTVFVNIGLIAHLDNEAQLAYILCHEFVHYLKQHSLKQVVEYDRIKQKKVGKRTFEDKVLLMYQFSRENETEADTTGLSIFLKTNYDPKQSTASLQILQYSDLPFSELKFEKYFFEDDSYKLPAEYFLKEFNPILADSNNDDTYKSHPNIIARQKLVENLLLRFKNSSEEKKYIVSETTFKLVREITRFECCRMFLVERDYMSAFKWAFLLRQKYPDNLYINKTLAKCLYALTLNKAGYLKYSANSYHNNAIPDYTKIEGSSEQINYFFNQIPSKELGILTMRFVWQNHLKYPDDQWLNYTSDTIIHLLFNKLLIEQHELQTKVFSNDSTNSIYYSKAFTSFYKHNSFNVLYTNATNDTSFKNTTSIKGLNKFEFENEKQVVKQKTNVINNRDPLIEKLLVIKPTYNYSIGYKEDTESKLTSEKKEEKLVSIIQNILNKNKISYELIDPSYFIDTDIEKYNQYGELNCWINERIDAGIDNNNPIFGVENVNQITQHYNAKYALFATVNSDKLKTNIGTKLLILYGWGWLIFPIPIIVYQIAVPVKSIEINLSIINLETGELVKVKKYAGDKRIVNIKLNRFIKKFTKEINK